jgi:hypothetical protein
MSDREHHCPFLNRSDQRCSRFFSMHDMQHAFEHCFDAYQSCGVYRDLLAERQARRAAGVAGSTAASGVRFLWATACTSPAAPAEAASDVSQKAADLPSAQPATTGATPSRTQFVQLRLPGNIAAAVAVSTAAAAATLALAAH